MDREVARRHSWETTPMSSLRAEFPLDLRLTIEEFERIKQGYIPEDMDDRWFLFYEDGWLYIHRSWTGFCIYQLRFEQEGNVAVVREALVTRDPEQYRLSDIEKEQILIRTILFYRFGIGEEPSK